jgi:dienelactone hydrolase
LRRFELILAFAAIFAVGWPVVFGVRPRRGIVAGVLSAGLLTHLQFEGYRWQMIPFYLVAIGLAVGDVIFLERRLDWSKRATRALLGSLGLGFVAVLPVVWPVPEIPTPSGPDPIGTLTVQLIDRARDEPYGEPAGGPREFVAQVWYPSQATTDPDPISWSEDWDVVAPAVARSLGLPSWFLNHTQYSLGHADSSAAMAPGTFPVIIYSHDWDGTRSTALNQIEHLVSNGYIVVAPDHAHVAAATVLTEGDVLFQDPAALPDPADVDGDDYAQAATLLVETVAGDLVTLLDRLEEGESGPFAAVSNGMDLNRIGIFGHGAGGGAAVKTCLEDARCKAVLGLDPWVQPLTERELRLTMNRPALYMRSDEWIDTANDALLRGIAARGSSVTYWLGVEGAAHNDFTMMPLLTPLATQFGLRGEIPAGRVIPIVDNYLRGFFDVFLLGSGAAALDSVTFPEVAVTVIDQRG